MATEAKPSKFETEDLPKILAALKRAHEARVPSTVTIDFAHDGGVQTVFVTSKERFK